MTRTVRFIGFDLDNTLYDQAQHMRSFFRAAAQWIAERHAHEESAVEAALVEVWTRRTSFYPRLFDEALAQVGLDDRDAIRSLVDLYHVHRAELSVFPGVDSMLQRLRRRFPLFMITDGNELMQRAKIESLRLAPLFDEIVITGSFGKDWSKPAVHAFQRMVDRFGGAAGDYLYVGDNPACDFHGAKALGMQTARVMTEPFSGHAPPGPEYAADFEMSATTELERVLT